MGCDGLWRNTLQVGDSNPLCRTTLCDKNFHDSSWCDHDYDSCYCKQEGCSEMRRNPLQPCVPHLHYNTTNILWFWLLWLWILSFSHHTYLRWCEEEPSTTLSAAPSLQHNRHNDSDYCDYQYDYYCYDKRVSCDGVTRNPLYPHMSICNTSTGIVLVQYYRWSFTI